MGDEQHICYLHIYLVSSLGIVCSLKMLKYHWSWHSTGLAWLNCPMSSAIKYKYLGWHGLFSVSPKINYLHRRLQVGLTEHMTHDWNLRETQRYYANTCFDNGVPRDRTIFGMQLSLLQDSLLNGEVFCLQSAKWKSLCYWGRNLATTKPSQKMSLKWDNKWENRENKVSMLPVRSCVFVCDS